MWNQIRLFAAIVVGVGLTLASPMPAHGASGKWEYVSGDDGVKVWRKEVEGSSLMSFKGLTTVKVPIGKIIQVFAFDRFQKEWVDRWADSKDLMKITPYERIFWIRFGLPWPIDDRDYVIRTNAVPDAKTRTVNAYLKSVKHSAKPEKGGCCVRGMAFGTKYRFRALPDDRTEMLVEVNTDPRGLLPSWLVNMIQKDWPRKTLLDLSRRASKPDIESYPGMEDWHMPYQPPAAEPAAPTPPAQSGAPTPPATAPPATK